MSGTGWHLETGLLRAVFDSVGAGMFVIDLTGRITAVNPYAQTIVGRSEKRLVGFDLHDLLHRDAQGNEVPREECLALKVLESGHPAEGSNEFYLRGDESLVPIIWAITPLHHQEEHEGAVVV